MPPDLLPALRAHAQRIHRQGKALPDAYAEALMIVAEAQAVAPFEAALLDAICRAQTKKDGRGVRRSEIDRELQLAGMTKLHPWMIWFTLNGMEQRGLVFRPSPQLWAAA